MYVHACVCVVCACKTTHVDKSNVALTIHVPVFHRSHLIEISDVAMLTSQNYTRTLYISGFAINFFLYTMSGRIFREQLEKIVCDTQRRDRSTVTSVEATSVL